MPMNREKIRRKTFLFFWSDQGGQATTEYVFLLAIAVGFAGLILKILKPAFALSATYLNSYLESGFAGKRGFHQLPFQGPRR
jgi:hypothetical protein